MGYKATLRVEDPSVDFLVQAYPVGCSWRPYAVELETTMKGASCGLLRVSGMGLTVLSVIAFGSISMFCGSLPLVIAFEIIDISIYLGEVSVVAFGEVSVIAFGSIFMFCSSLSLVFAFEVIDVSILSGEVSASCFLCLAASSKRLTSIEAL
ncbi:17419_t:CDS:2, partial [Dentiscutata erythropus]